MQTEELQKIIRLQREYFDSGRTLSADARISSLKKLRAVLEAHETEIYSALERDLGKSMIESYMCELGMVYSEITYMIRHLKSFSKEKRVRTPLAQFQAKSYVKPSPRGTVLIMSPWNYPLMLTLDPLTDALAAGNTAVIKPSAYAPALSDVLKIIISEAFEPGLVSLVTGGRQENQQLLEQKFDYIFFTGSKAVGREVLRKAAENLTPVCLELGGKSPCIVDRTADIKMTARRIVFGKYLNCGQTCVAPDYICCERSVYPSLLEEIKREIARQYGENPLENRDCGRIVNRKHYDRLSKLLSESPVLYGGRKDDASLRIEPTVIGLCDWDSEIMKDEIFGPLLPILTYDSLEDTLDKINLRPHPLALYIFSEDKKVIKHITEKCPFGGGCINDTIIHLATENMGFGGVGESGMGAYHGKKGFDTFSHFKSIVHKRTWIDLPMRYQPYKDIYFRLIKLFLK